MSLSRTKGTAKFTKNMAKNDHSPRARRRKMKRFLDKNFPIKKTKDNE